MVRGSLIHVSSLRGKANALVTCARPCVALSQGTFCFPVLLGMCFSSNWAVVIIVFFVNALCSPVGFKEQTCFCCCFVFVTVSRGLLRKGSFEEHAPSPGGYYVTLDLREEESCIPEDGARVWSWVQGNSVGPPVPFYRFFFGTEERVPLFYPLYWRT